MPYKQTIRLERYCWTFYLEVEIVVDVVSLSEHFS